MITYSHLLALSKKFRMYFFCSMSGFIVSTNCSAEFISSPTYEDCPVTWLREPQDIFDIVRNGVSQQPSNSRSRRLIPEEITLEVESQSSR